MHIAAINEYKDLSRELSRISRKTTFETKLEAGQIIHVEFDLTEFLNGIKQKHIEAGTKPKHLGLIWKDLVVEVKKINIMQNSPE